MNKMLTPEQLENNIRDFLKEHKQGSLSTTSESIPRCSPVQYFLGKDRDIYILSYGGEKFDNINKNPNVCLLVNTDYLSYKKIKGVQAFGKAATSEQDTSLYNEAMKYCPEDYLPVADSQNLKVIKVVPEQYIYLDSLENGERTKQILKNNNVDLIADRT